MFLRGFCVSAAAIARLSTPAKLKTALVITAQYPRNFPHEPVVIYSTNGPGFDQYLKPIRSCPGIPPRSTTRPKMIRKTTKSIFRQAKKNSILEVAIPSQLLSLAFVLGTSCRIRACNMLPMNRTNLLAIDSYKRNADCKCNGDEDTDENGRIEVCPELEEHTNCRYLRRNRKQVSVHNVQSNCESESGVDKKLSMPDEGSRNR
jgi:hypothetical protein